MKAILLIFAAIAVAIACCYGEPLVPPPSATAPGVPITREEAQRIISIDLDKLEEKAPALSGQLVRLKFNYRSPGVEKKPDGSIESAIRFWLYSTGAAGSRYKSGSLDVIVPPQGAVWFLKIPSNEEKRGSIVVIARLGADADSPAQLLGREIKTDLKGSRIVW